MWESHLTAEAAEIAGKKTLKDSACSACPAVKRFSVSPIAIVCCAALWVCWPRALFSHETLTTTVLFDREIVRVLNAHCVMCHVENGPSFPLVTYEQTWLQGRNIRADVIARHMPPWAAVSGYGQFVNDNSVTMRETQFIVSWVEGLGPRNGGTVFTNVADASAGRPKEVRAHVDLGRWTLGEPDLMRQFPATTIDPQPSSGVARAVVDVGLTAARLVRALEYVPGDRRVVRAAFFTLQETGQWLGSWTPWYGSVSLPAGVAYRVPAGGHIVAEIHYRGVGDRAAERGTLGLFFADTPASPGDGEARRRPKGDVPMRRVVSDLVLEPTGDLAAVRLRSGQARTVRAETRLAADTYALALRPQLATGVTSIEVSARKPNGSTEILLFAKDPPIEWPTPYIFKAPVLLPVGTRLSVIAAYADDAEPRPGAFRLTVSRYQK